MPAPETTSPEYWKSLDSLISECKIVIDRPAGSHHPHYHEVVYPLDYGYLDGTSAADRGGIDLWIGSLGHRDLTGLVFTIDLHKRDAEVKLLLGCSSADVETILGFLNTGFMRAIYMERPG